MDPECILAEEMETSTMVAKATYELAKSLVVTTEALLTFERTESSRLRALSLNIQHDMELIIKLLEIGPETKLLPMQFRGEFIQSMHTVDEILKGQQNNLSTIAVHLQNSERPQHEPLVQSIKAAHLTLSEARSLFNLTFKRMWRHGLTFRWKRDNDLAHGEVPQGSVQATNLVEAFDASPFCIGADSDAFMHSTPSSREEIIASDQYQVELRNRGRGWVLNATKGDLKLDKLHVTHAKLMEFAWCGEAVAIEKVRPEAFHQDDVSFPDFRIETQYLNDGLRDTILKERSPFLSIVFVGAEDAGKSTFLNALIGVNILPSSVGPTTSYPCRIQHVPDQSIPELSLGVEYLEKCLKVIRSQNWHGRILAMGKGTWKGKGLPVGFDFPAFKSRWRILDASMETRLKAFSHPDFKFPTTVVGAADIRKTLRDVNDFIRLCRNLPVGFDHLEPSDWPHIRLNSPTLAAQGINTPLELVDIPGIGGANSEFGWHEMINETIRKANVIVAVISLQQFGSSVWRRLPRLIAQVGNNETAAIVLTMRDSASVSDEELEWQKEQLRDAFWPHLGDALNPSGPIFACSSILGPSMEDFGKILIGEARRPTWDEMGEPILRPASELLYPTGNREFYDDETIENLRRRFLDIQDTVGFHETLNGIAALISLSRRAELLSQLKGGLARSRRIGYDIRRMLAAVGKAPGDIYTPTSEDKRKESDQLMELLDLWNERARAFGEEIRGFALRAAASPEAIEERVNVALIRASTDLEATIAGSPTRSSFFTDPTSPSFARRNGVNKYLKRCQEILHNTMETLDQTLSDQFLRSAADAFASRFHDLQPRVEEIDDTLRTQWPLISTVGTPTIGWSELSNAAELSMIQQNSAILDAFARAQETVLRSVTKGTGGSIREKIEHLRFISRALLAAASIIPFFVILPYWIGQSGLRSYKIRVAHLRTALTNLASEHSAELLRQLCAQILEQARLETEVATHTISGAFAVPDDYDPASALPTLSTAEIQQCVAAYSNLLASTAAMDMIESMVHLVNEQSTSSQDVV